MLRTVSMSPYADCHPETTLCAALQTATIQFAGTDFGQLPIEVRNAHPPLVTTHYLFACIEVEYGKICGLLKHCRATRMQAMSNTAIPGDVNLLCLSQGPVCPLQKLVSSTAPVAVFRAERKALQDYLLNILESIRHLVLKSLATPASAVLQPGGLVYTQLWLEKLLQPVYGT